MDKTAIKNFAVKARRNLIEQVTQKAYELGIEKDKIHGIEEFAGGFEVRERENGEKFKGYEKEQRDKLILKMDKGFDQVMEEVAYTWFNRFIALRFMEVNGYLPTGVRVLSSTEAGKVEPDIIREALNVNLDIDQNTVFKLQDSNDTEGLYKYLLIKQCNQLGKIMPSVFEEIADYTELLLPDNLLAEGSVVKDLVESIEEYDWKVELSEAEQDLEEEKGDHGIEIIGWLYQYYISEKHVEVVGLNTGKIKKEDIPAATQLFTPKWIVKYMVENTLGRLWFESHPDEELKTKWKYYLEEAEQESEVQRQLDELKNPGLDPEKIKVLDPAMGSGHILVYAFDVFYDIYLTRGYAERQIPKLILEKNLYGLDIDDRANQLASFALLMVARGKNREVLKQRIELNICSIQESNLSSDNQSIICSDEIFDGRQQVLDKDKLINYFVQDATEGDKVKLKKDIEYLLQLFGDAKNHGSILNVKRIGFAALQDRIEALRNELPKDLLGQQYKKTILEIVPTLIKQGIVMSQKYDVVCTNPPYMGNKYINDRLKCHIADNFKDVKADLFSVFIDKGCHFAKSNAHLGFMAPFVWMFITSYKKLREAIIRKRSITSLIQLEYSGFAEATVPICTFTFRNTNTGESGEFIRLTDFKGPENQPLKTLEAISNPGVDYRYTAHAGEFSKIPGSPIVYWATDRVRYIFQNSKAMGEIAEAKQGLATANNALFLRMWSEVAYQKIGFIFKSREEAKVSDYKWFPYNKGGDYRRWYGNNDHVINWEHDGLAIRNYKASVIRNQDYYFKKGITWTFVSSSNFGVRYFDVGFIFDVGGSSLFINEDYIYYIVAFMCSKLAYEFLKLLNPTLNFQVGNISSLPVKITTDTNVFSIINEKSKKCISISKSDWDSFETSWDFLRHPLITHKHNSSIVEEAFSNWGVFAKAQFKQLKLNEEELNRIFIDIYGLQDELTPEVEDKDITIRKADRERDIKSFISYAVGCMFGRYSLDEEGLVYAGGDFSDKYRAVDAQSWEIITAEGWKRSSINIAKNNVVPIADGDYFEDDILERFVDFVKVSFSVETLEENLYYIAETLGKRTNETSRQAIRRYFLRDFYKDHVRTYRKRPIYWLFDSGRQNGFKALIYMHRYEAYTVARIRTDYLHKLQKSYDAEINHLDILIDSDISTREKAVARKRKEAVTKRIQECMIYDQAIAHVANQKIEIDLDDGVVVNYAKFQSVEIPQGDGKRPINADLLARI